MEVNMSADWGEEGEINISPDNIEVGHFETRLECLCSTKLLSAHIKHIKLAPSVTLTSGLLFFCFRAKFK